MSLLMGLGKGLVDAGQAVGRNFAMYAQMMNEQDRDKMRQASLEKRWAVEDSRYKAAEARSSEREARDELRYQDSKQRQDRLDNAASSRTNRLDDREAANALGSGIDRLDKIRADKESQIKEMFTDPMTKSVMDPEGYNAAMSALRGEYASTAAELVQRSGLSEQQINKYGFSAYLPSEQVASTQPGMESAPLPSTEPSTPLPDVSALAQSIRDKGWSGTTQLAGAAQLTPDQMAQLTPEQQKQRYEQMMQLRSQQPQNPQAQQQEGLMSKIQRVW